MNVAAQLQSADDFTLQDVALILMEQLIVPGRRNHGLSPDLAVAVHHDLILAVDSKLEIQSIRQCI
jgi:hypothetical protein